MSESQALNAAHQQPDHEISLLDLLATLYESRSVLRLDETHGASGL